MREGESEAKTKSEDLGGGKWVGEIRPRMTQKAAISRPWRCIALKNSTSKIGSVCTRKSSLHKKWNPINISLDNFQKTHQITMGLPLSIQESKYEEVIAALSRFINRISLYTLLRFLFILSSFTFQNVVPSLSLSYLTSFILFYSHYLWFLCGTIFACFSNWLFLVFLCRNFWKKNSFNASAWHDIPFLANIFNFFEKNLHFYQAPFWCIHSRWCWLCLPESQCD